MDPGIGPVSVQNMLLGILFVSMAVASDSAYALLAGTFGKWFKQRPSVVPVQRVFSGGGYISLGVMTASSGSGRNQ